MGTSSTTTTTTSNSIPYSGVLHIRFPFWGGRPPCILGFGVPSRPNSSSGAPKWTLPGPRKGSSILNAHLVVMSAAVVVDSLKVVWMHNANMIVGCFLYSGASGGLGIDPLARILQQLQQLAVVTSERSRSLRSPSDHCYESSIDLSSTTGVDQFRTMTHVGQNKNTTKVHS
jgi:hypothetical protein